MLFNTFVASCVFGLSQLGLAARPDSNGWHGLNHPNVHHFANGLSITTPPDTDMWRPNVTADNFTAPYVYKKCKTADFKSIEVTITAPWKTLYDQGGLAVAFPCTNGEPMKWVKSGIEFNDGAPALGTVATDRFSDWSLSPMVPPGAQSARIRAERSTTELWVYKINEGGERQALREVTWAFLEERGQPHAEMWVGVYAAKPTEEQGNPKQGLKVSFTDIDIKC